MTITHSIWNLSCALVLTLFFDKSNTVFGAVTLDQLDTVCMYGFAFDFNDTSIPPKEMCTAVGTYSWLPPPAGYDLSKLKMGLPYVFVYDTGCTDFDEKDFYNRVLAKSEFKIDDLKDIITTQKVDVLVLNFVERETSDKIDRDTDRFILSVYQDLKSFKKDLLIGLMLPRTAPSVLMTRLKDTLCDLNSFFVVETYDYEYCKYRNKQAQMALPPTNEQFSSTLNTYDKYPVSKVFFTLELEVKSWKNDGNNYEEWPYNYMCIADPGPDRKYCVQTLEQIHTQVVYIRSRGLAGIFVKWADYDDSTNTCLCGKFPALRVIERLRKGLPKDDALLGCKTYGQHK